jgi:zinc protease
VEEALNREMDQILAEPISEEELQTAIKQSKAQFAYSSESVTNQGFWLGYASIVADVGWFEGFIDSLEAVTVDDVTRAADSYLRKRNRTVGRYIPQGL